MNELSQTAKDICGIIGASGLIVAIIGLLVVLYILGKKEQKYKEQVTKTLKSLTKYLDTKTQATIDNKEYREFLKQYRYGAKPNDNSNNANPDIHSSSDSHKEND